MGVNDTIMAQFRSDCQSGGRKCLGQLLVCLALGTLIGCTGAVSTPRAPLPDSQLPGSGGEVAVILQTTTQQLLFVKNGIQQQRNMLGPDSPAVSMLQEAINRLDNAVVALAPFVRTKFSAPETTIPGTDPARTTMAIVDSTDGLRLFETAVVQDQSVEIRLRLTFDGFIGGPEVVADNYQAYTGILSKDGLSGTLRHFSKVNMKTGPADFEWEWQFKPAGVTFIRISDGGLASDGQHFVRRIFLAFNSDFSGQGTVTQSNGSTPSFAWP